MDKREQLKSMLNNMINDKPEQASLDLHNYLTSKMREVSGLAVAPEVTTQDDSTSDFTDDVSTDE